MASAVEREAVPPRMACGWGLATAAEVLGAPLSGVGPARLWEPPQQVQQAQGGQERAGGRA
jgi:hypothetical protein